MNIHTREARRLEMLAALLSLATAAMAVLPDISPVLAAMAAFHVALTMAAVMAPAAITAQVISGQALAAGLLLTSAASVLRVVCVVAAVIAAAELLAAAENARRAPLPDSLSPVRRAARAALLGATTFGAVYIIAGVSAPGGILALLIGASACVFLARAFVVIAR